ncbi:M48 family metallopeptidase [Saccharibacter floricola]|uniref:Metal-dependent hydrolase n=1 Tax=Saccharibacter floricola DSM 15669 TaxID=1123227 RepID=A0ABQ0P0T3_9PROT|nr:SprT family zinc-dependent metalloprotease [Saccharibacter floricola]GBQ08543.1 metal-dependent hydrolase [Saccharibacter floricola DSM 15669]
MDERVVHYGGEVIRITCVPLARTGTKLRLKVQPDLSVQALVPDGTTEDALDRTLQKKARWIWQKLRDFKTVQQYAIKRDYVSGESYFYLGRRHLLKVHHQPEKPENVRLLRGRLEVSVHKPQPLRVRKLLELWYFTRAQEVFHKRLAALLPSTLWVATPPVLKIQVMQMQWGNCSPDGAVTLNPHLVKAPRKCIDYVIFHELCHIKEHHHGPEFWALLKRVMPDWERYKAHLDRLAEMLLQS